MSFSAVKLVGIAKGVMNEETLPSTIVSPFLTSTLQLYFVVGVNEPDVQLPVETKPVPSVSIFTQPVTSANSSPSLLSKTRYCSAPLF